MEGTVQTERETADVEAAPTPPTPLSNHLLSLAEAFRGKQLLALVADSTDLDQLERILQAMECGLARQSDPAKANIDWVRGGAVLLLSTKLGDSSGIEYFENLRRRGLDIPVILLGDRDNFSEVGRVVEMGADVVLLPLNVDEVLLRVHRQLHRRDVSTPEGARNQGEQWRILVAEDDRLTAHFLTKALSRSSFDVTHAPDGGAAVAALQQNSFHAAILDVDMPQMDGYGVLSKMRLMAHHQETPVLMLTSRSQETDVLRAFDLGADDYVTKPFNPLEVISRIRRLAGRQ